MITETQAGMKQRPEINWPFNGHSKKLKFKKGASKNTLYYLIRY